VTATHEVLEQIEDAIADWETGPDAVRFNAPPQARLERPNYSTVPDWVYATLTAQVLAIVEWLERRGITGVDTFERWIRIHAMGRCPGCAPMANPPRLAIDGAEYSRRRRARRRRT